MRLRLVREPFDHPDYIFELKHDGFRALAYIQNGECKLISRNENNLRFNSIQTVLGKLPVENAIIDGEVVCLDANGTSQFNHLLDRKYKMSPLLYAFDLLWLDGIDLRQQPLVTRKEKLATLIRSSWCARILYAQHIEANGKRLFHEIVARDLEGIVGKRKVSVYKDDGTGWLKVKNREYSQAMGRHELLTKKKI
jgi:bifunctional non-homologous end joining protein LigD